MAWLLIKHLESHIYCPYMWKYVKKEVLTKAEVYWVERNLGSSLLYFDFRLLSNWVRNGSLKVKKQNTSVTPTAGGPGKLSRYSDLLRAGRSGGGG